VIKKKQKGSLRHYTTS